MLRKKIDVEEKLIGQRKARMKEMWVDSRKPHYVRAPHSCARMKIY